MVLFSHVNSVEGNGRSGYLTGLRTDVKPIQPRGASYSHRSSDASVSSLTAEVTHMLRLLPQQMRSAWWPFTTVCSIGLCI